MGDQVNPLLEDWTAPFEAAPLDRVRPEHFAPAYDQALAAHRAEIAEITKVAKQNLKKPIGMHTHDDSGLGVANALAGLEVGAVHVQGTINGYGERTGNCNLTSVIPNVAIKMKKSCVPEKSLRQLKELSQFVDEIANLRHSPRQPWVGSAAFSHKGGTHVNAVQKLVSSYEHIDPSLVGNSRTVLISGMCFRYGCRSSDRCDSVCSPSYIK